MDIKLTAAQEKLIEALKANPGTDAQEHLNHIHNQAIADEMIDRLLKFGILQLNPETGLRELAPAYMVTATVNADVDAVEEESDIIPNVEFGDTGTEKNEEKQKTKTAENSEVVQPERINKKGLILEMLQTKASLDEMVAATGWEEKSVRGVISQLKKEKHLNICREKDENKQNFYYIAAACPHPRYGQSGSAPRRCARPRRRDQWSAHRWTGRPRWKPDR